MWLLWFRPSIKCIMTKSRGQELRCVDAILQLVEIKSVEKTWLLVFRWQTGLAWQTMLWAITKALCWRLLEEVCIMCGQSRRLCAEDCPMSIWFAKVFWDQAVCCCTSSWMQSFGGQQEWGGDLMLTKCWTYWRATRPLGRQHVNQAPNLLQCQVPPWRPSAEPTQCQAPDRTPRVLQDECLIGCQWCHDS